MAERSDKGISAQDLRPIFQPIYHPSPPFKVAVTPMEGEALVLAQVPSPPSWRAFGADLQPVLMRSLIITNAESAIEKLVAQVRPQAEHLVFSAITCQLTPTAGTGAFAPARGLYLQRADQQRISTTDPDATPMRHGEGQVHLGYQTHYVVDGGKAADDP